MPVTNVVEYERAWIDGLNRGDLSSADESFAADCIIHITGAPEPICGVPAWKEMLSGLLAAFPDLHFTIEDQMVDGDHVALRWRAVGTHTGPLGPMPATGRPVTIDGLAIDRLKDGKVMERWEQWDQPGMLRQLGVG